MAQHTTAATVDTLIGERVHQALWRARMTQQQLGAALGLDHAAISRRLRGRTAWKVAELVAAAQLLGLDVQDLMPTHDELGAVGAAARRNEAAESRCTPARGKGRAMSRPGILVPLPGRRHLHAVAS